jgi:hypothetical protein
MPQSIILSDFAVEPAEGGWRLECRISADGFPSRLSFLLNIDPQESTVREPNWAAISLLYPAMLTGHDLVIEADLCPKLLFFMRGDLQGLLATYNPDLRVVKVDAGQSARPPELPASRGVATGFSAGVDSFTALREYSGPDAPECLRVTHLSVHNLGAWGPAAQAHGEYRHACNRASEAAARLGLSTLFVSSNVDEIFEACRLRYPENRRPPGWHLFQNSHTLRNLAAASACVSRLHTYLYASSFPYDRIGVQEVARYPVRDPAMLDPLLLPILVPGNMAAFSAGARLSRVEKTKLIADHALAQELLDVCVKRGAHQRGEKRWINCSKCPKCIRTMATLESVGKLDLFRQAFDVDMYISDRTANLRKLVRRANDGSKLDQEIIRLQAAAGLSVPLVEPAIARRLVRGAKKVVYRLRSRSG